jgi:hypothetical protein
MILPKQSAPVRRQYATVESGPQHFAPPSSRGVLAQIPECAGKPDGTPCGIFRGMICVGGECVFPR